MQYIKTGTIATFSFNLHSLGFIEGTTLGDEVSASEGLVSLATRRDRVSERRMLEFLTKPLLFSVGAVA